MLISTHCAHATNMNIYHNYANRRTHAQTHIHAHTFMHSCSKANRLRLPGMVSLEKHPGHSHPHPSIHSCHRQTACHLPLSTNTLLRFQLHSASGLIKSFCKMKQLFISACCCHAQIQNEH